MSGIWVKNKGGWETAVSQKFGLEKELHGLAEKNMGGAEVAKVSRGRGIRTGYPTPISRKN